MKNRHLNLICLILIFAAACRPETTTPTPGAPPFPTVTPGRLIRAAVPPAANAGDPGLSNPATALAAVSRPTATPDLRACPAPSESVSLPNDPPPGGLLDSTLISFLDDGGTLVALESRLQQWGMIGDGVGGTRGDLDLTGEGTPEIVLRYQANGEGVLLIAGCIDGRVIDRYRAALSDRAPEIISVQDANVNGYPDLLFAAQVCDGETCRYQAQMVTWQTERGRFVNLIAEALVNDEPPTLEDIDNDRVGEIIARSNNPGDGSTGPLRTGFTAWDWDGLSYVRSITQFDPPRFRIQVIHEADAAFDAEAFEQAIPLYQLAADDAALENWLPDDNLILKAYALYRLLLVYSYTDDDARAVEVQGRLITEYPDTAAAPPYVQMGLEFWNGLQVTNNLRAGCGEAFEVVNTRLDAVGLLNRYGTRAPVYDAASLCPF